MRRADRGDASRARRSLPADRRMAARWVRLLPLLAALLAAGCGQAPPLTAASPTPAPTATPIVIVVVVTATPAPTAPPVATAPPPTASPAPEASPTAGPAQASAAPAPTATAASSGTFRICAAPDPATERAIASLIAGHSFRATLTGQGNGCAQLGITVSPGAIGSGKQSTDLTVDGISVQIVSENGATQVHVGAQS